MKNISIIKLVIFYFISGIIYNLFFIHIDCFGSFKACCWACFFYVVNYVYIYGLQTILLRHRITSYEILTLNAARLYSIGIMLYFCFLWLKPALYFHWSNSRIGGVIISLFLWILGFIVAFLTRKR